MVLELFEVAVRNPFQFCSILTILVSFWFIFTSLVFYSRGKLLFLKSFFFYIAKNISYIYLSMIRYIGLLS